MAITLGLVEAVDATGVYVSMPGARGVLRGPYETLQNVTAGDKVLMVTTDDGDNVIVGQAAAAATGVVTSGMIADGTIVNADISGSAAIDRSKISGLPTSSTDNTVPRFDGTAGALQTSGVTVDDSNNTTIPGALTVSNSSGGRFIQVSAATSNNADINWATAGSNRWSFRKSSDAESGSNVGSNFVITRRDDSGSQLSLSLIIWRNTGKVTFGDVGTSAGIELGSSGPTITTGTGAPSHSAPNGSVYLRTDGTSTTTLYIRASGAWVAK